MVDWWLAMFNTLAALGLGYFWHSHLTKVHGESALKKADDIVRDARKEAAVIIREAEAEAKDVMNRRKEAFEKESRQQYDELVRMTNQFTKRETKLFEMASVLDERDQRLEARKDKLEMESATAKQLVREQQMKLEEVAALTEAEARDILLQRKEEEARVEAQNLSRTILAEAKSDAEENARKVVALAIERLAAPIVNEVTTCSVDLPTEEMKGRLIGKEGRNIRSFEQVTGVNLVIDETPMSVTLSGYDPLRREVARRTLEHLIKDGRIHPGTIEETMVKNQAEVESEVQKAGEEAIEKLGLQDVADELAYHVGRLKYRHSYTQNILDHSVEMALIMANMAGEMGLDTDIAKRIGLFHDIGKGLTHEVEGTHAIIGANLIKKHGESEIVVNAVAAHHREVEPISVYAYLTTAADAITAARPGARMESTQIYLERLGDMEGIANGYDGVESSYAIHAGRELRVMVKSEDVDDEGAMQLARDISADIATRMEFPGQIKVVVMRETRCVEYAR